MSGTFMDVQEHGICLDKEKRRVQCNYCGKQMQTFNRLKCHLGGVGTDVTHCEQVIFTVREAFRNMLMKDKPGHTAAKRVGEVQMGNPHKRGRREVSSSKSVPPKKGGITGVEASKQDLLSNKKGITGVEADKQDLLSLSNKAQKSIGRFFYENCFDFSALDTTGFREMMRATTGLSGVQMRLKFPDSHDLKGPMLQEALKEVQDHVKKVKDSWEITGCSILLDAWVDQKGHDLVSFVADSPAGPVYLKSFDVSEIKSNANALISLVDGLVDEVGVHNVVQIIACSTSGWVGELGKSFALNNRNVFWSLSMSHCFELMLLKIGEICSFGDILDKVNNIFEFINDNPSALKFLKDHSHGTDMTVSSSEFEFVTPYLTLESVFKAKNNLAAMFASSVWNKEEGIRVSKLVKDSSFWKSVERVVKSTSPLIRGLLLLSNADNQHVGYIYDTMDGIKKSINDEEQCYKPLWDAIDDVWNNQLHSPLHATGYYLNPAAFYSVDFHHDTEIIPDFLSCAGYIVEECYVIATIGRQLEMYRVGEDCFKEASQDDQISKISPAEWWAQKACQHPELQSFAIKILSQTCEGASRYKLKRTLAEKMLLTRGMSRSEQQHLEELAFVHYNFHLQSCKARQSEEQ